MKDITEIAILISVILNFILLFYFSGKENSSLRQKIKYSILSAIPSMLIFSFWIIFQGSIKLLSYSSQINVVHIFLVLGVVALFGLGLIILGIAYLYCQTS